MVLAGAWTGGGAEFTGEGLVSLSVSTESESAFAGAFTGLGSALGVSVALRLDDSVFAHIATSASNSAHRFPNSFAFFSLFTTCSFNSSISLAICLPPLS